MDAQRWKRVDELLQQALDFRTTKQEAFLRQACAGEDAELLQEIQSLLIAHQEGGSFLEEPLTDLRTQLAVLDASAPTSRSMAGQIVSHYRIESELGSGGMGVVYQAEDINLGRRVAVKFLPGEVARNRAAFERLEREARAASSLDHPNICSIYEFSRHEGQPFIVMQLLEGQTLQEWIEVAPKQEMHLRWARSLDLAIQITSGLDAAHQKGIIHRDIKPPNIFVTARGEAKILDFALAKLLENRNALVSNGSDKDVLPTEETVEL